MQRMTSPASSTFQSTLPRRERHYALRITEMAARFQSTLPRRERRIRESVPEASVISIHAPAKGATSQPCRLCVPCRDFNPRSREGSDLAVGDILKHSAQFQSTLPRRERRPVSLIWVASSRFQSTLPRRERPGTPSSCTLPGSHFNPRSREGSDSLGCRCRFA